LPIKFKFQRLLKKFFLLAKKTTTLWSSLYMRFENLPLQPHRLAVKNN
jgi:hypothetical protein